MIRQSISGLVLAHGERDIIPTITSLEPICDQIVVVNDLHNPATWSVDQFGDSYTGSVTTVDRFFDTFPEQRNAGLEKALGGWVLVVDSDETVSPQLVDELKDLVPRVDTNVFVLPRREVIRGRELERVRIGGPHPRLFRSHLRYAPEPFVHERLQDWLPHDVEVLEGHLLHHRQDSVSDLLRREFRYGKTFGKFDVDGVHAISWPKIMKQTIGDFTKRGGLSEGMSGIIGTTANASSNIGEKLARSSRRSKS